MLAELPHHFAAKSARMFFIEVEHDESVVAHGEGLLASPTERTDFVAAEVGPAVKEKFNAPGLTATSGPGFSITLRETGIVDCPWLGIPLVPKELTPSSTLKVNIPASVGVPLMVLEPKVRPGGGVDPAASPKVNVYATLAGSGRRN